MQLKKIIPLVLFCTLAFLCGLQADEDLFGADTKKLPPEAEVQLHKGAAFFADKKFEEAVACYRKAAELGSAKAQFNLGSCYMTGTGVKQNIPMAIEWLHQAADQGVTNAYYPLGACCCKTEDYAEAYAWALAADATGDARLKTQLEDALQETVRDKGKRLYNAWKAKQKNPSPKTPPKAMKPAKS